MTKFILKNLDCPSCAKELEDSIKKLKSVKFVSIDFGTLSMLIDTSDIDEVTSLIKKIEPQILVVPKDDKDSSEDKDEESNIKFELITMSIMIVFYIGGILFLKRLESTPFHIAEYLIFILVYIVAGWRVIFNAFKNIVKGGFFDENFLMTIATGGAIAIHALPEAAGVMIFYKIGEMLQDISVGKSRRSIKALLEVRPDYANLLVDNEVTKVPPNEVGIGDKIIVKPGEKIPLDGVVILGDTQVDTSALTGESVPKVVKEGSVVLAGMINKSGAITIDVTKKFGESSINRILLEVENAIHKKAKTEQFFTTFAKFYTPLVVFVALFTAILPPIFLANQNFSDWIYRALVILVISCPCALVVSIPLAYFGGIGRASKNGILIKGSNFLEALNSVKTVVFDKTGTITKGVFKVSEIFPKNGFTSEKLIEVAAKCETYSNHPIALSIKEAYSEESSVQTIKDYKEIGGKGVIATIYDKFTIVGNDSLLHEFDIKHDLCKIPGTVVHVAQDGIYMGYLIISDQIKEDSVEAIQNLKKIGVEKLIMLTGDNEEIAREVTKKVGLTDFFSELLPEDKVAILENLINQKNKKDKIVFVGDGVNDAPVIARADIGISMGNLGSDAAIETADIVIMNDSLLKIGESMLIAKKTKTILIQNIVLALFVKVLFILLGFMGVATMWEAVFGDVGVTLLAVLNSTRILRFKATFRKI